MRLVKPGFEIVKETGVALVERAGRCCYQSEGSDRDAFVRRIIDRGHRSVIEHLWLAAEAVTCCLPFMRYANGVMYGNARAWLEHAEEDRALLPLSFRDKYPAVFDRLERTSFSPGLRAVPLPERVTTVRFTIDRGVSHEMVRHRPVSYSQESTRYCRYDDHVTFVIPPWVKLREGIYSGFINDDDPDFNWHNAMIVAENRYVSLLAAGWSPQQARSVLPNSLKTELYVTAHEAQWQHMFALRCATAAHPQMREVMVPLREVWDAGRD